MIYDGWIVCSFTRIQITRYKGRICFAARTLGARAKLSSTHLAEYHWYDCYKVILSIPSVIFLEMNLSYLGFGIGSGQSLTLGPIELTGTSIGVILNEGQQQILQETYG